MTAVASQGMRLGNGFIPKGYLVNRESASRSDELRVDNHPFSVRIRIGVLAMNQGAALRAVAGRWKRALVLPALACWFLGLPTSSATAAGRPNFVVLLTDDQRWDALGVVQT